MLLMGKLGQQFTSWVANLNQVTRYISRWCLSQLGFESLGILRALADIGIFEIVASLEATGLRTVNRTIQTIHTIHPHQSRSHWLMSLAKDLQWLTQVLPRGDRTLVAIAHAVASHVMFASLGADSDGYVRIESMSSITQAWWLAEQAASAKVRSMCEVGFNGGHSALAMLLSAAIDASMISFDLMSKSYTPACHRLVRLAFPTPPHPGGRAIQLVHTQFRTLKFAKQMRLDIHRWWACWERSTVGLASYVNACYWRSSPCHGRRWLPIQFLRGPHQGMEVLYNIRTSLGTWLSRRSWATMVLGHVQPLTKHDFQLFSYTCW